MAEDLQAVGKLRSRIRQVHHVRNVQRPVARVRLVQGFLLQIEAAHVTILVPRDVAATLALGAGAPVFKVFLLEAAFAQGLCAPLLAAARRSAGIAAEAVPVAEIAFVRTARLLRLHAGFDALGLLLGDAAEQQFLADILLALAVGGGRLDIFNHLLVRHLRKSAERQGAEQHGCGQNKFFHISDRVFCTYLYMNMQS